VRESKISGTESPIGTKQAANDSARVGVCGDVWYKAEVQKNTRAIIILDMLGALHKQIFSAIAPSLHGKLKRASIRRRK